MQRILRLALIAAVLAVVVSGCGTHHLLKAKADASAAMSSPQFRHAQVIVSGCLKAHPGFTKTARKAAEQCIAGKGSVSALETCAEKAAVTDHLLLSRKERLKWSGTDLPNCVVSVRG